jgi:hypothetical protein
MSALLPELDRRDADLTAISPQTPDESLNMQQKKDLGFAVLPDPGNILAGHVGIPTARPPKRAPPSSAWGLYLTTVNADATIALPMPAHPGPRPRPCPALDRRAPDYSIRSETSEILAAPDRAGR